MRRRQRLELDGIAIKEGRKQIHVYFKRRWVGRWLHIGAFGPPEPSCMDGFRLGNIGFVQYSEEPALVCAARPLVQG